MYELTAEDTELIRRATEEDLPALAAQTRAEAGHANSVRPSRDGRFYGRAGRRGEGMSLRRVAMFAQLQPLHARFLRFREPGVLVRGLFRFRA